MNDLIKQVKGMANYSVKAIEKLNLEIFSAKATLELQQTDKESLAHVRYADTSVAIAEVNSAIIKQKEHIEYLEHLAIERGRELANYKALLQSIEPLAEEFSELKISRVLRVKANE